MAEGWAVGLSTGPYCLGACAPFMVPLLLAEGRRAVRGNLGLLAEFLLGRLLAYLLVGAALGWLGVAMRPHGVQRLAAAALAATAVLMILYAVVTGLPQWRACAAVARWMPPQRMPLVLGFLIGINVCPPFLVASARVLHVGGVASGAVFFLGFFTGTSLYTLPLLLVGPFTPPHSGRGAGVTAHARLQAIGRLSAVLVGAYFLLTLLLH